MVFINDAVEVTVIPHVVWIDRCTQQRCSWREGRLPFIRPHCLLAAVDPRFAVTDHRFGRRGIRVFVGPCRWLTIKPRVSLEGSGPGRIRSGWGEVEQSEIICVCVQHPETSVLYQIMDFVEYQVLRGNLSWVEDVSLAPLPPRG